jgi:hypothetical protein
MWEFKYIYCIYIYIYIQSIIINNIEILALKPVQNEREKYAIKFSHRKAYVA